MPGKNVIKKNETIPRKKVLILFPSRLNFDEFAFKYFIANLNKTQKYYECIFLAESKAYLKKKKYCEQQLINLFLNNMPEVNADYYINIMKSSIKGKLFYVTSKVNKTNAYVAFITTDDWKKRYSPPSLFFYLLHSIIASLMEFHPKLRSLSYHYKETKGCINDYTLYKTDNKVDIALGYICDECKNIIIKNAGMDYYKMVTDIISNKWIGDQSQRNSVAYDLKKYFNLNIDEDSGFNKSFWEKTKDYLAQEATEKIVKVIFIIIFTIIVAIFGINLKNLVIP